MKRALASVQRVVAIEPIPNADAIELARIKGWQCVVKKQEFAVGDLGVFLEINAVPPDDGTFRFLWQPKPKEGETPAVVARPANFRIRTMKLRGALSQGLLLPLAALALDGWSEGEDVTARLGVEKYDPPAPAGMGEFRAPFPGFLPKTDEMRVQSVPGVLEELRGLPYVVTLKCDGTSASFCIDARDDSFHVCGRNHSILGGGSPYWRVARACNLEEILRRSPNYAVQGEVCGPGIQKNRLGLPEVALLVFSVYDIEGMRYLDHDDGRAWLDANGLRSVEILERGEAFTHSQASLLELAEGKYPGTSNEREGVVVRPCHETFSSALGGRLSFKAISNRFLLKEGA